MGEYLLGIEDLEERVDFLTSEIDYKQDLVWQISTRFLPGRSCTENSMISGGRVAAKVESEVRYCLGEMPILLSDIRDRRSVDADPLITRLNRFNDTVRVEQALISIFKFDVRRNYLPREVLERKEVELRRFIEGSESDPEIQEARKRLGDRNRPPLRVISLDPVVDEPVFDEKDLIIVPPNGAFEVVEKKVAVQPGVRNVRENRGKTVAEAILPGGEIIEVEGINVIKVLGVLLPSKEHLTMKQIARLGWGSPEASAIALVSPSLKKIELLLQKPGTHHSLDKIEVDTGATKPAIAYLVKDLLNRQSTPKPEPGKVTIIRTEVITPPVPVVTNGRAHSSAAVSPPPGRVSPSTLSGPAFISQEARARRPLTRDDLVLDELLTWVTDSNLKPEALVKSICQGGLFSKEFAQYQLMTRAKALFGKSDPLTKKEQVVIDALKQGLKGEAEEMLTTIGKIMDLTFKDLPTPFAVSAEDFLRPFGSLIKDGYILLGAARRVDGIYGPNVLNRLQAQRVLRSHRTDRGLEIWVADLAKVKYKDILSEDQIIWFIQLAEQELAKKKLVAS